MEFTLSEASKFFGIEKGHMELMVKKGLIKSPLSQNCVNDLTFLQNFWGNEVFLRLQVMALAPAKRKKIVEERVFNKVEKYIYSRYLNLKKGEKLSTDVVAIELKTRFGVPLKNSSSCKIREIRKMAQIERKKHRKTGTRKISGTI
jgi:hypothetical protein